MKSDMQVSASPPRAFKASGRAAVHLLAPACGHGGSMMHSGWHGTQAHALGKTKALWGLTS